MAMKLKKAATDYKVKQIGIAGGVSANKGLRSAFESLGKQLNWETYIPSFEYCTDNAAMIAAAAWHRLASDGPTSLSCGAYPNLKLDAVPR